MALKKLNNGQYIKVELDGTVSIYKTRAERLREKRAPLFEVVRAKYKIIIHELQKNKERLYYDPAYALLLQQWEAEFEKYIEAHRVGHKNKNFPLMSQYFPNVSDSLPELICKCQVGVSGTTLAEVYESVRRNGYFGEVEDC
jgi:hypothetical protein